jgi:hypothetical protein
VLRRSEMLPTRSQRALPQPITAPTQSKCPVEKPQGAGTSEYTAILLCVVIHKESKRKTVKTDSGYDFRGFSRTVRDPSNHVN